MDKQLANQLRPLFRPDVQDALTTLLRHRRDMNVNLLINGGVPTDEARGAIKEIDQLLQIRQRIIDTME